MSGFTELGESHATYQDTEQAGALRTNSGGGGLTANLIAHTLRGEGFDASEDGTGRGTPLVPVPIKYPSAATGNGATRNAIDGPPDGPMFPLEAGHQHAVAFSTKESGRDASIEIAPTLRAESGDPHMGGRSAVASLRTGVRRLTPREYERLMAFPDDYTRYDADGNEISDSARYRMLGNSIVTSVAEWLGRRIVAESIEAKAAA